VLQAHEIAAAVHAGCPAAVLQHLRVSRPLPALPLDPSTKM
jgi:hypothetical protein